MSFSINVYSNPNATYSEKQMEKNSPTPSDVFVDYYFIWFVYLVYVKIEIIIYYITASSNYNIGKY